MRYHQCRLHEVGGSLQTVGWIEDRGAKLGAHVELKEYGKFFEVKSVSNFAFEADELRQKQQNDRGSLPSINA